LKTLRLAQFTAFATYLLLVVGGLVNPTGSSLACPDWPLCFGQVFPEMKGGVLFEHSHRLVASAVGLLTVVLTIAVWRTRKERLLRGLALLALGLVVFQGVLGGITVIYRLPSLVSSLHLATSMLFFMLLVYLAFRLSPALGRASGEQAPVPSLPRRLVFGTLALVYFQVVVGGLVRHLGAGRACGDDPFLCGGSVWPSLPVEQLHVFHRFVGVAVLLAVLTCGHFTFRLARKHGRKAATWLSVMAPCVALTQVGLGLATVMTNVAVVPVTAHLAGAALLLVTLQALFLALGKLPRQLATGDVLSAEGSDVAAGSEVTA
jgi:heme A synthase